MITFIYLAGPVEEADPLQAIKWREDFPDMVESNITRRSDIQFINPLRGHKKHLLRVSEGDSHISQVERFHSFATPGGLTRRCVADVLKSDIIVANLLGLDEKRAMGTFIELGVGASEDKPIFIIIEADSPLRHHPILRHITSVFTATLVDCATSIAEYVGEDDYA